MRKFWKLHEILNSKIKNRRKNRYNFNNNFGNLHLFLNLKIGIYACEIFAFLIKIGTRKTRKMEKIKENGRKIKSKIPIFHALLL